MALALAALKKKKKKGSLAGLEMLLYIHKQKLWKKTRQKNAGPFYSVLTIFHFLQIHFLKVMHVKYKIRVLVSLLFSRITVIAIA